MKDVDLNNFDSEVMRSELPVIVFFRSEWCPTCKALGPIIESVSGQFPDKAKFVRIDTAQSEKIAVDNLVFSAPTIIIFENGQEIKRHSGFLSEKDLKSFVEKNI